MELVSNVLLWNLTPVLSDASKKITWEFSSGKKGGEGRYPPKPSSLYHYALIDQLHLLSTPHQETNYRSFITQYQ